MILYLTKQGYFSDYRKDLEKAYIDKKPYENEERIMSALENNLKYETNENNDSIVLAITKDLFFDFKEIIRLKIINLAKETKDIKIIIDGGAAEIVCEHSGKEPIEYVYSKKERASINKFSNFLKLLGIKNNVKFSEYFFVRDEKISDSWWDISDIKYANEDIEENIDIIRESHLSPYEQFLAIYSYITERFFYGFNTEGKRENADKNNSIVSALKYEKTNCVGFASTLKAFIDKLDNPNLKAEYKSLVYIGENKKISHHSNCIIEINDEKYNIHGRYFSDPSADSKPNCDEYSFGFGLSLFPLTDMNHELLGRRIRFAKTYNKFKNNEIDWCGNCIIPTLGSEYWINQENVGAPISLEKTSDALTKIYKSYNYPKFFIKDLVEKIIEKSKLHIMEFFTPSATNAFMGKSNIENE